MALQSFDSFGNASVLSWFWIFEWWYTIKEIKSDIWNDASLTCSPIYLKELQNWWKINQLVILAYCFHYYNGMCIFMIRLNPCNGHISTFACLVIVGYSALATDQYICILYILYIKYKVNFPPKLSLREEEILYSNPFKPALWLLFYYKKIMFKKDTLA